MRNKETYGILAMILVLATLIRILPYVLGYDNLIMGDTVREYQQVLYILENGEINFNFIYGQYPVLHLLIAGLSILTGVDPNILFRFVPQFVAALGTVVVFFLLREFTDDRIALVGAFLLAVFGPHVWWSMKPVRETIGLFMFPLLVYLYYKLSQDDKYFLPLVVASLVAIFSHHWSIFLALVFLGVFVLFTDNLKILFVYLATVAVGFSYFYYTLSALQSFFGSLQVFLISLIGSIAIFILVSNYLSQIDFSPLKKWLISKLEEYSAVHVSILLSLIALSSIILVLMSLGSYFVYSYSWFFLSSLILLLSFAVLGAIKSLRNYTLLSLGLILITGIYIALIFLGILADYQYFDPGRVAEFLIFPLLLPATLGIILLADASQNPAVSSVLTASVLILFFLSGLFVLPIVYLSGEADDVRSYLQYVPVEGNAAIDWAYQNNAGLVTDNTYVLSLYDLEQYIEPVPTNINVGYVSEYDMAAAELAGKVNVASIGSRIDPDNLDLISQGNDRVYSNGWAYLYTLSDEDYQYLYDQNPYSWFWGGKL